MTGAARYTDDLAVPGAWFGLTVRSTEPHARLLAIDRDPAFDWSRVVVVTAADIPGENVVGLIEDDQPALVADEIRHPAEAIALVAAADPATARAARAAISIRTEPFPAVLDLLAAEKAFARYEITKGDLQAGFAGADRIVEGTYRVGPQEHIYIEPQAMIAAPEPDGGISVTGSLQCPYYVHGALARALALPVDRVRVIQAETGGGFGGKEEYPSMLAIHAALLARAAGRPVRMTYDRHEDILATTKRHPAVIRHRTGVAADGRLVAQDIDVVMDAGAYETLSPVVLSRGALHATGPYRCPNVRVRARAVMTNTPPNGAFRGFGAPQVEFAAEVHLSRIAEALGISPVELRRRLAYRAGDITATGQVLRHSVAAVDVLERAVDAGRFEQERARTGRERARDGDRTASGVGLALGWHGAGFTGSGEVTLGSVVGVEMTADARIRILTAQTEMGQGSATVLPQIAAEWLGVAPDWSSRRRWTPRSSRTAARRSPRARRWSSAAWWQRQRGSSARRLRPARAARSLRAGARISPLAGPPGSTSVSAAIPASSGTRSDTGATPTPHTAGRPRLRSWTWTSTPGSWPCGASWRSTRPGAS